MILSSTQVKKLACKILSSNCSSRKIISWPHRDNTLPKIIIAEVRTPNRTASTKRKRCSHHSLGAVKSPQADEVDKQVSTSTTSHRKQRIRMTNRVKTQAQVSNRHSRLGLLLLNSSHRPNKLTLISSVSSSAKCLKVQINLKCKLFYRFSKPYLIIYILSFQVC